LLFTGYKLTCYVYHMYMCLIAVFCTNSINIYAGIKGLECGQSLVIAVAMLAHNYVELNGPYGDNHQLSMVLLFPFLACSCALFVYNKWPSEVFTELLLIFWLELELTIIGKMAKFIQEPHDQHLAMHFCSMFQA